MKILIVSVLGFFILNNPVFSMGGNKPGPHGGYIKMPGTYHVELLQKENQTFIYLLDLSMKNPTIENSFASLNLIGAVSKNINCKPNKNYYICDSSKQDLQKYKRIEVKSMRRNINGKIAIYELPLKLE